MKIKRKNHKIRNTSKWQQTSKEIRLRDNNMCQICLHVFGYKNAFETLSVHHILKLDSYPELAFDSYNLICLCPRHHNMITRYESGKQGACLFDDNGDIVDMVKLFKKIAKDNTDGQRD